MNIIETNLKFGAMTNRKSTSRIILHHAEASHCTAADIHRWHLNNGWAGAGYHFLVRKDGSIYRLRPENKVGSHAKGANSNSIGICFEGAYMTETMPQAQINAGKELVAYLKSKYGISKVQRHSDVYPTSCPGTNFPFDEIAGASGKVNANVIKNNSGNKNNSNNNSSTLLKVGSRGAAVQDVQKKLVALGYNVGSTGADGVFGNATKNAVIKFQKSVGISQDGIVGSVTLTKLNDAYNSRNKGQSITTTTSYTGKDYVRKAQVHMNNFAGAGLATDGLWGANSRKGLVKCLQRALNKDYKLRLGEDGIRGNATNNTLGTHYVKRGETQYLVTFVEIGLMALGYYNSSVESPGVFGSGLETAVRNFQSAHGLVCDGIAGKGTILKILACLGC